MIPTATSWGVDEDERALSYPCDRIAPPHATSYWRGVTVRAPAPVVFRWLCQLRVAPYSYDWIDNFGRQSPRSLTPGLDRMALGHRFMTIFELGDFETGTHVTLRIVGPARRIFGDIAASYVVKPLGADESRLLVKLRVAHPRLPHGWLQRAWLPAGDLVMMRRQLLNLKSLAEGSS